MRNILVEILFLLSVFSIIIISSFYFKPIEHFTNEALETLNININDFLPNENRKKNYNSNNIGSYEQFTNHIV